MTSVGMSPFKIVSTEKFCLFSLRMRARPIGFVFVE